MTRMKRASYQDYLLQTHVLGYSKMDQDAPSLRHQSSFPPPTTIITVVSSLYIISLLCLYVLHILYIAYC